MIQARSITAVVRELLPQVQPLRTRTILSGEGMVLGYELTLPEPAARNIGLTRMADTGFLTVRLSLRLGQDVHVSSVWTSQRRDYSRLAHVVITAGQAEA